MIHQLYNLTNWWCGYKPNRMYNGIFTAGFGVNTSFAKYGVRSQGYKWKYQQAYMNVRFSYLNTFAISKQVDVLLELEYDLNQMSLNGDHFDSHIGIMAGFAYKFKKRTWSAPIVPVCPTWKYTDAEGDALVARLQAADAKITDLENQLKACLNRPMPTATVKEGPLATVYFPINSSRIAGTNVVVVKAIANAMAETDAKYTVTGWADNYTGTADFNDELRKARANSVAKMLERNGVDADKMTINTDNNNLTCYGAKSASLDRAVTITAE